MILEITRSYIRLKIDDKVVKLHGEAYLPGHGSPDFVVYAKSIDRWEPPDDVTPIDEITRARIIATVKEEMAAKRMTVEIE